MRKPAIGVLLAMAAMLAISPPVPATDDAGTPLGRWLAHEPGDGATTVVEIYREGDTLSGRVLRVLGADGAPLARRCAACPGPLRGQPLEGMRFLWGLRQAGDHWRDGSVLDLRDGLTQGFRADAEIRIDHDQLVLRASRAWGTIGETRRWQRADAAPSSHP